MARSHALIVLAAAFAIGGLLLALNVAAADLRPVEAHAAAVDDDDDDDDDGDEERITLPSRPIAGLGPAQIRYVPGVLLVRFRRGTSGATIQAAAARAGGRIADHIPELRVHVLEVPPDRVAKALASLRAEASVVSVEREVFVGALDTVPNDVLWPAQWGLRLVGAPRAWDATRGAASVVIAVLDTGLDRGHPDVPGAVLSGVDLVNDDGDSSDDEGHGTSVGGVVAARTHNGEGQAGTCWACSLLPVKVLNAGGAGTTATVAEGIVWAADHGARVVNMSLGGPGTTSALANAVAYASQRGIVLVAAAGNSGVETPFYPAAYAQVISVSATTASDTRYEWSNHGSWVEVAAPGCNPAPRLGGYIEFCGTSSAAPIVAGIAGLVLSLKPAAAKAEVEDAIASNATPVGSAARIGRVNAPAAIVAVAPNALPPPPPPPPAPPPPPPPPAAPPPPQTTAPGMVRRPRLLGRARVGRVLRVAPGIWNPNATRFEYQWRRCRRNGLGCRRIRGAGRARYRLNRRDRGRRLRAVVIAVNPAGAFRAETRASSRVRGARRR